MGSMTEYLYLKSGYVLDIADDEPIDDLVVGVVVGDITQDQLQAWLKNKTVRFGK